MWCKQIAWSPNNWQGDKLAGKTLYHSNCTFVCVRRCSCPYVSVWGRASSESCSVRLPALVSALVFQTEGHRHGRSAGSLEHCVSLERAHGEAVTHISHFSPNEHSRASSIWEHYLPCLLGSHMSESWGGLPSCPLSLVSKPRGLSEWIGPTV